MFLWIGKIALGAGLSQVILFLGMVPISRLYSPNEIGKQTVLISFATILSIILSNSYPSSIPLADSEEEAQLLTRFSILRSCVGGALIWLLCLIALKIFEHGRNPFALLTEITLAILLGTLISLWGTARAFQSRNENFDVLSKSPILGNTVQTFTQILLGLFHIGFIGLISGVILGRLSSTLQMFRNTKVKVFSLPKKIRKELTRKWKRFTLLTTPAVLINTATVSAVTPLVAFLFDTKTAGFYFFITVILSAPSALFGQAVSTVLLPVLAGKRRTSSPTGGLIEKTSLVIIFGSAPFFLAFSLLGPEIIELLFGSQWTGAFEVTRFLIPWFALNLVSSSISSYSIVNRRLLSILAIGLIEAIARTFSLYASAKVFSDFNPFLFYSLLGCIISYTWIFWIYKQSGLGDLAVVKVTMLVLSYLSALVFGRGFLIWFTGSLHVYMSLLTVSFLSLGSIILIRKFLRLEVI